MSLPPLPPPKSSQRQPVTGRTTAAIRIVDEYQTSNFSSPPSMRRQSYPSSVHSPDDDPRRLVQGAVRAAASGSTDNPIMSRPRFDLAQGESASESTDNSILSRPRPRIEIPATQSPPGSRTPININWEDGVSYMGQDEISELSKSSVPISTAMSRRHAPSGSTPAFWSRNGSFGSGKPRGLPFHDARRIMRSGRGLRSGSWHDMPSQASSAQGSKPQSNRIMAYDEPLISPLNLFPTEQPHYGLPESTDSSLSGEAARPLRPQRDEHPQTRTVGYISASTSGELSPIPEKSSRDASRPVSHRPSVFRRYLKLTLGEFLGTTSFLFMVFGAVITASTNTSTLAAPETDQNTNGMGLLRILYISITIGIAYAVNLWTFLHVSKGFFNPAATLALLLTGSHNIIQTILLLIAQLAGSIAASALALGLFQTTSPTRTTLAVNVSIPRGVFIEAVLTAQVVLAILLCSRDQRRTSKASTGVIGLFLCASELIALPWTGGSLNPARSFGPNVVSWSWESTHWVYWAGPMSGSVIAVIVFHLLWVLCAESNKDRERDASNQSHPSVPRPRFADAEPPALTGTINMWSTKSVGNLRGNSPRHKRRDVEQGHF